MGSSLIHNVLLSAMEPGAEDRIDEAIQAHGDLGDYNLATMVFLPKKPSGRTGEQEFYDPAATRPLSIVNSDNRIAASAMRLAWEPVLEKVISPAQQGFLRGRSILKNVLDIDEELRHSALDGEAAACILFDFKAAFPSVAHEFIMEVLRGRGGPDTSGTGLLLPVLAQQMRHVCVGREV